MKHIGIGICSFLPFVSFFATLAVMISAAVSENPNDTVIAILVLPLSILTVLSCYAYIIGFIIHAIKSRTLTTTQKCIWVLLVYLLNIFIFPIYYFKFIAKD